MIQRNSQLSLFGIVISTILLSACGDKYANALEKVTLISYKEKVCRLKNDIEETLEKDKCDDVNGVIAYQEAEVLGIDKDRIHAAIGLGETKAKVDNPDLIMRNSLRALENANKP